MKKEIQKILGTKIARIPVWSLDIEGPSEDRTPITVGCCTGGAFVPSL